jgi:hypothetical protein
MNQGTESVDLSTRGADKHSKDNFKQSFFNSHCKRNKFLFVGEFVS